MRIASISQGGGGSIRGAGSARRGFSVRSALSLGMACFWLACPAAVPGLAGEQGESAPPAETAASKTASGTPDGREKEPAPKPAPAAAAAPATPGAPGHGTVPAARKARPAPAPKPAPEPVLRFTDDDLLKYREPLPEDDNETEAESEEAPAGAPVAPGAVGPAGTASPPAAETAKPPAWAAPPLPPPPKPPPSTAVPAAVDPLREHHAREADRARRGAQIDAVRAELASIDGRLGYLRQKRQAILDPLNIMPAARTEEERQANASLKPKDLLDQVDQQIKDLEKQRESVQERLASIETRFGGVE